MGIKGLTDKAAAFPIIGELRKGEEKPKEGNRPGKDLTYFRFTTEDALAMKMFAEAYPNQEALRNINVFLPHKTADENIDSWIEKWVAGGLVYRSDGEVMALWRTDKSGYSTESRPDPKSEVGEDGKRKDGSGPVGRLSVIVPELGRFATVTVLTTSKNDIMNLTRQLRSYEALRGDLRGIPFIIKRRKRKVSTPGENNTRVRREKWLLSIETQPAWTMAQLGAMERAALPANVVDLDESDYSIKELPTGISDPFEEADEFDLEQSDFFDKAKKELGITPAVAGYILKGANLINGNGYQKADARNYWAIVSTTGVDCQRFVSKILEQVKFYTTARQILEYLKLNELAYDVENEEHLFEQLASYAQHEADAKAA